MYTGLNKIPYFCNYFITFRCNSTCRFCNFWRDPSLKNLSDAKITDVKKNLDDLKRIGLTVIDFLGGEPLLFKELPLILRYAKELGFFVKLSTNGILYEERAHELKDCFSRMYISLDTVSREEYKTIRGSDGFLQIISGIKAAKQNNQDICLICTITNDSIHNIDQIANFAKENKVTTFLHPCFSYFGNKQLNKDYIKNIKKYFWHPYIRMNLTDLDFFYKGGNNTNSPRCLSGRSTIDIGPDNCLLTPCFHKSDKKIQINGDLFSLFHSNKWGTFYQKAGSMNYCKNCSIDCYFGHSYWDKIRYNFLKGNITQFKNVIEIMRSH